MFILKNCQSTHIIKYHSYEDNTTSAALGVDEGIQP